ncbi:MAG TPA: mannose-1-phosphate guanylyltransferase [Desulfobacteraceae bacterium]|nr:mannose-1-phosphate guanylyltransferase [Desulfobacteraceae bacterium]
MDDSMRKLLIVMADDQFKSLISIGDIQRAIIKNVDLGAPISSILRQKITVASTDDDLSLVKARMKTRRNEFMPVVSQSGELVNIIFWKDLFEEKRTPKAVPKLNLPVIIMAGGKGTRLKPLTNILPKPLIPIGDKTFVEEIMDRFVSCGCCNFYLSLNHKAEFIRYYFDTLQNADYHIKYFQEDNPLGTAGSLHLLNGKIQSTFFVTNCDIIIDQDYHEILKYHLENKNEITVAAALKNYSIPYGTLTTRENGLLQALEEKPDILFKINTGFYILEPHLINEIPENQFYHITYLIEKLQQENRRVGVFPVSEKSWTDIGNWDEYFKHTKLQIVTE